jgi:glutathione S-transferase
MKTWRKSEETEETRQAMEEIPHWLGILNDHLAGKEYMVGGRFTLADVNVFSVVNSADFIGYDLVPFSEVKRWKEILLEREALKKVLGR